VRIWALDEWREVEIPGAIPTDEDRELATALREGGRLEVDWLAKGARIRSTSWIGSVRFTSFGVEVMPKLVGGQSRVLAMVDYATGLDALRRLPSERDYRGEPRGLVDIWCLLLAEECERILSLGLLSDYTWEQEALPRLRGRIVARDQLVRHFGRLDVIECRYEDLVTDVWENQLLLRALLVGRRLTRRPNLSRRLTQLGAAFSEYCRPLDVPRDGPDDDLTYHRRNQHYRPAHQLALLLLRDVRLRDIYGTGSARAFAFLIDMDPLFERFVSRLVETALKDRGITVHRQASSSSILVDATTGRSYKAVRPDLLLEDPAKRATLPLDCKYKLYDWRRIDPGDIYQTFLYAYAYRVDHGVLPSAMILYPADDVAGSGGVQLAVVEHSNIQAARLRSYSLPVAALVDQVESGGLSRSGDLAALREILVSELARQAPNRARPEVTGAA
jgi:5-methylcytosine-specific restriction enzyme subunit McrC